MEDIPATDAEGALLGLPETQTELDVRTYARIQYTFLIAFILYYIFYVIFSEPDGIQHGTQPTHFHAGNIYRRFLRHESLYISSNSLVCLEKVSLIA